MSSQLKFIIYKCDTCNRETEIQLDGVRPDPSRCNITLKCRGKLHRNGERSAKKFLFTPIVLDLEDYVPRGTILSETQPTASPTLISISTGGGDGMLTAAVLKRRVESGNAIYYVTDETNTAFDLETVSTATSTPVDSSVTLQLFELTPELLTFKKYTYVTAGSVQLIRGADNSPEGKNLRFNINNKLRVFTNGIELETTAYDRTTDDQLTFTPSINDTNNVIEILVYNDIDQVVVEANLIPIVFNSLVPTVTTDLSLRALNCWGNFGGVTVDGINRYSLFAYDLPLDSEKTYGVARIEATSSTGVVKTIKPSEFYLLLGREPFAVQDKELSAYVTGSEFIDNDTTMSYNLSPATGSLELSVDSTGIKQVFKPLVPFLRISTVETENVQGSTTTSKTTEVLQHKYILGPS